MKPEYELKQDKEFMKLMPDLKQEEKEQLTKSLLTEGLRDALITWNNYVIDGNNRYEICKKNKIKITPDKIKQMDFKTREEVKKWIILNQFGRRNLSKWQRSSLALKLESMFKENAKENLKGFQKSGKPIHTDEELGKLAKTSKDTIHKARTITVKGTPEIKKLLGEGKTSINKAYKQIKNKDKTPTEEAYQITITTTDKKIKYFLVSYAKKQKLKYKIKMIR